MNKQIATYICSLLILFGCTPIFNQSYEELSKDAFFFNSGGSSGYIKSSNDRHRTIYPRVVDYVHNDRFILAVQIPDREDFKSMLASELNTGEEKFDTLLMIADSILVHDPYYKSILSNERNFWVIVNSTHELIGPLSYTDYLGRCKSLQVPEDLTSKLK